MSNKAKAKIEFSQLTWVINNLPAKDLDAVDNMTIGMLEINNFMSQEIENGGQFSIRYDDYSDCISVSLTYLVKNNVNTGFAVSGRGADFEHCIKIVMYKFYEVANGKLESLSEVNHKRPKYG